MKQEILEKARQLFEKPLFNLISESHLVHCQYHDLSVQKCRLLSIKTGACPEDCGYCAQSVHHKTDLKREPLMGVDEVREEARSAKKEGATRFCMGAAWRQVRDGKDFDRVLEMVKAVKAEGLEVCVTLGMLTEGQAVRLREAGVYAYNHNLDTSRDYYPKITSTRHYDDRLQTLKHVRAAGITVCSGGIIGLGESQEDRCALLAELASLDPQPESVPINLLSPVKGTPLANSLPVDPLDLVRMVAVARILMPKTRVRLSAGRITLTRESQTLAFLAGANSIFVSEKMLTVENPTLDKDNALLEMLFTSQKISVCHRSESCEVS